MDPFDGRHLRWRQSLDGSEQISGASQCILTQQCQQRGDIVSVHTGKIPGADRRDKGRALELGGVNIGGGVKVGVDITIGPIV